MPSRIPLFKAYEANTDPDDYNEGDIMIYAGVPYSFNPVRPFLLCNKAAENILVASGGRENKASVILSILKCYARSGHDIEIWANASMPVFKRYKNTVFQKYSQITDLEEICGRIANYKNDVQKHKVVPKLVVCFGYNELAFDMEILGNGETQPVIKESVPIAAKPKMDMMELARLCKECTDPAEKARLIKEYNQSVGQSQSAAPNNDSQEISTGIYDARDDMKWIIRQAPVFGLHFLMCFDRGQDFLSSHMDEKLFKHKLLFSMSSDESLDIMGNQKASGIDDGVCLYSNGQERFTLKPHIFKGVPCSGWVIDDDGNIVRSEEGHNGAL